MLRGLGLPDRALGGPVQENILEGCLKEGACLQPCFSLPEPSAWGIVAELPACCYVGSLTSVPLLLPDYPAEGPHPTPSLSLLGTPVLVQMLTLC